jgi:hypothetical protein
VSWPCCPHQHESKERFAQTRQTNRRPVVESAKPGHVHKKCCSDLVDGVVHESVPVSRVQSTCFSGATLDLDRRELNNRKSACIGNARAAVSHEAKQIERRTCDHGNLKAILLAVNRFHRMNQEDLPRSQLTEGGHGGCQWCPYCSKGALKPLLLIIMNRRVEKSRDKIRAISIDNSSCSREYVTIRKNRCNR